MLWISCSYSENFDFGLLNRGVRTTTVTAGFLRLRFMSSESSVTLTNKKPEDAGYEVESPVSSLTQIFD